MTMMQMQELAALLRLFQEEHRRDLGRTFTEVEDHSAAIKEVTNFIHDLLMPYERTEPTT